MATKNRTETKTTIDTTFVPTLQIVDHRSFLNEQADNLKFRKDVKSDVSHTSGNRTINFSGVDFIDLTITGNSTITISGMEDGDVKYLKVTKPSGTSVTFNSATRKTNASDFFETTSIYEVLNKDGANYVALKEDKQSFVNDIITPQGGWEVGSSALYFPGGAFFLRVSATNNVNVVANEVLEIGVFNTNKFNISYPIFGGPSTAIPMMAIDVKVKAFLICFGISVMIQFLEAINEPMTWTATGFIPNYR